MLSEVLPSSAIEPLAFRLCAVAVSGGLFMTVPLAVRRMLGSLV